MSNSGSKTDAAKAWAAKEKKHLVKKLTQELLHTYQDINEKYYERKRQRLRDQKLKQTKSSSRHDKSYDYNIRKRRCTYLLLLLVLTPHCCQELASCWMGGTALLKRLAKAHLDKSSVPKMSKKTRQLLSRSSRARKRSECKRRPRLSF